MNEEHIQPHRFKVGQLVYVQIRDWEAGDVSKFQTWREPGRIDSLTKEPFGYNVRLSRTISFRGNYPLPILDKIAPLQDLIFVREGDLSLRQRDILREKLREFMSTLIFREVAHIYIKPQGQIQYINYYSPDGKVSVITDDKKHAKEQNRLGYKVGHFFGFSCPCQGPTYERQTTSGIDFHFTMNRFGEVDFWEGIKWSTIEKNKAFLVKNGSLICGISSQQKESSTPSFDQWFVCSRQFKLLCYLLVTNNHEEKLKMKKNEIVANLIMPENPENFYIPHEIPLSRYLYAAVYLLACLDERELPEEWNLPSRKSPETSLEPFSVWWPRKVLE
jgi:hypothetical protein